MLTSVQEAAAQQTILAPGSTWEYTFTDPTTVNPTWKTKVGEVDWSSGNAPFGNVSTGVGTVTEFNFNTFWPADGADGDDLWVRAEIDLSNFDRTTIQWHLGVDNGFKLYINGNLVDSKNAEGYTFRWEYSGAFATAHLLPGKNVLAVALEDHGGATAFDMQVTGTKGPPPPPDPVDLIGNLIDDVLALNLPQGIETSLVAKLNAAKRKILNGPKNAAVNQINAFINEVLVQSAKNFSKIPPAKGVLLITDARIIREEIFFSPPHGHGPNTPIRQPPGGGGAGSPGRPPR